MHHPDLVIVTRTGLAGAQLLERLRGAGWSAADACPMRLAGPQDPKSVQTDFAGLAPFDRIVVTSAEGLRQSVELLGVKALNDCPIVVPGPGSREEAIALGLARVVCPGEAGNSEAMLALPELTRVNGRHIVILAAAGGRRLLDTELASRGARVSRLQVYRRLPRPLPTSTIEALARAQAPVSLIASAGALEGLQQQLPGRLWRSLANRPMVVPSPRVLKLAHALGCRQPVLARGAYDEAMIEALLGCTNGP